MPWLPGRGGKKVVEHGRLARRASREGIDHTHNGLY